MIGFARIFRLGLAPGLVMCCGLAVTLGVLVAPVRSASALTEVTAIRVGTHKSITRIVFSISRSTRFRLFELANPYRIVLDLPIVRWRLASEIDFKGQRPLLALRFGAYTPTTTRVVIDVSRPMQINRAFSLRPKRKGAPWRLVIDLKPVTKDAFARHLAAKRSKARRRVRKPITNPKRRRGERPMIVLDPGHGGVDPGARGVSGVREKTIVLRMARRLRHALLKTGRYRVRLTRNIDVYVPLRRRYRVARKAGADLFISLHADSNPVRATRGLSVYTLSERASDKEAAALAKRENRSDIIAGVSLRRETDQVRGILIDLAQRETMNLSARFAEMLVRDLRRATLLLPRTHRFAGFAVLKAPDVPSVLIELGYLTNRFDERRLRSAARQRKVAVAIVRAVNRYFAYLAKVKGRASVRGN